MYAALVLLTVGLLLNPDPAMAYLDPGSGSYMIQVTIGLIAGAVFMIKKYWVVIKSYFNNLFKKTKRD